eukprot:2145579-Prymnesium_polylepis.1
MVTPPRPMTRRPRRSRSLRRRSRSPCSARGRGIAGWAGDGAVGARTPHLRLGRRRRDRGTGDRGGRGPPPSPGRHAPSPSCGAARTS